MPEDIPEPPVALTEAEIVDRASAWSDYRKDYGQRDGDVHVFKAGWDAGYDLARSRAEKATLREVSLSEQGMGHIEVVPERPTPERMPLRVLTESGATFGAVYLTERPPQVTLSREQWENMGRPLDIEVTIAAVSS